ncbi:MAG: response regulator transcription factor [Propionibacteriaceae bacterium]|nr:response regulator transcription factor [Propionibacteriaceae bacterium]
MTRVMLVDDQEMIRVGLRTIIDALPDMEVIDEASDGLQAVRVAEHTDAEVVLMDIRMPGIDGVEAIRRIRRTRPPEELRIIILTTYDHDQNVLNGLRAGANGFLSKGVGPAELATAIQEVAAGGGSLSAAAASILIDHVADAPAIPIDADLAQRFGQLTPRETEIVTALLTGDDYAQIAAQLYLSPLTVKTHANRAMAKVGARDRAQLVSYAYQAGITP